MAILHRARGKIIVPTFASRLYSKLQVKEREALRITRPPELVREFIQDCLYATNEGYFNRHVNIFSKGSESAIDWPALKDENEYLLCLQTLYRRQEEKKMQEATPSSSTLSNFQQMWHTPTVLFEPWFGYAVAKYVVEVMRLRADPKLILYEVGPGNAALCLSILDYLRAYEPLLYETTEYHLIEISSLLHAHQRKAISASCHASRVTCHHKSILDWAHYEREHCFVLAFELLDNLPHDKIKFGTNGELLEGRILTNDTASYSQAETFYREVYEPATDPLILRTVDLLDRLGYQSPSAHRWSWRRYLLSYPTIRQLLVSDAYEDPYSSDFIPTMAVAFYTKLERYFPRHSLILSDFSHLPDTIPGYGSPVVQTRLHQETIACSTYLLKRGLFDIFFPTDFQLARKLYSHICGKKLESIRIASHAEWMAQYADVRKTTTKSGFNPLIEEFQNVQFLLST